jgi:hypothetical protein
VMDPLSSGLEHFPKVALGMFAVVVETSIFFGIVVVDGK